MTNDLYRVDTALISVSDKTGVVEFAHALAAVGIRILSTGGTHRALSEAGIPATEIAAHTGFPEMMDGRVKTLHPLIHGGLLGRLTSATTGTDAEVMQQQGVLPIDLLVLNLYPFEETVASGGTFSSAIENIDIGGPAMLRSAAKNFARVACVVDPDEYGAIAADLNVSERQLGLQRRFALAQRAFRHVADYDVAISNYLGSFTASPDD